MFDRRGIYWYKGKNVRQRLVFDPRAHTLNTYLTHPGTATAVDTLFHRLRGDIISGQITAGSKINEAEISRHYKVGRSTVREALARLVSACLVSRRANAGARVIELSLHGLLEIYHVREALEGMACRLAAQNMSEVEIAELQQLLEEHMQNSELQEGRAYYQKEGDLDFHYRLVKGSANGELIRLLCDELYAKVRMYRYQFGMLSPRASDAFSEHRHIVRAIADRDGEMAEMLMRRHIRASRINVERQMGDGLDLALKPVS
ncbi:MAG: GntR family transcriptional regulator [Porticoccaceae bacterium]|nr:GntR family transcriptional regulator [Porticoccaceae bacterium]